MTMLTGMDIGGTNTDIAFIDEEIKTFKLSNSEDALATLSKAGISGRLGVSTSRPLNQFLTGDMSGVMVITIPGPGLECAGIPVAGAVDHRGEVVELLDKEQVLALFSTVRPCCLGIAGKFAVRNPELELGVAKIAARFVPRERIVMSHPLGNLDFPGRIATTEVNARIAGAVTGITGSIKKRFPDFLYFKGDGGLAEPGMIQKNPALLLHSSPAAVALGEQYLAGCRECLVVDIGGTTTDIIPICSGGPVMQMLVLRGRETIIPSVSVTSVPYGGDSQVDGNRLLPRRIGNAKAFGGPVPTLTDALNLSGNRIGAFSNSLVPPGTVPGKVIEFYVGIMADIIRPMRQNHLVGTGFLAEVLIPLIAGRSGKTCVIPDHAGCANAIGVAVSRVSLSLSVHADSGTGRMTINGSIVPFKSMSDDDLVAWARAEARRQALAAGANPEDLDDVNVLSFNSFDVIREGRRREHITDLTVQIEPGITKEAL
jgi:N-methylhydantoinase A/oxoprolinase/acetone carboxylase beta subunit